MARHYHFIGIGGIGMSAIAQLLLQKGVRVSGSDLKPSRIIDNLKKNGAEIFIGHQAQNIKGADLVIYSSAIKEDNPEMRAAKAKKLAVVQRAQALAELMKDKKVITVTGSHGKTTTTALCAHLLLEAGLCPSSAIGGVFKNIDNNVCAGKGDFFVAEADESDGSFLYYRPRYSVITNIDHEHLDYYRDFKSALAAFQKFIAQTQEEGCLFCCSDDDNLRRMAKAAKKRHVLFGLTKGADIYPAAIKFNGLSSEFDCFYRNKFLERFSLALGGSHNISNSLSVIALGLELAVDLATIKHALATYQGTSRRLEIKFQNKDYTLIDDYAHHPTEIQATLKALKNLVAKRTIAVFQPHRYSRTKLLLAEFGKCFTLADELILTDIYPASEKPIPGISAMSVYESVKRNAPKKRVEFVAKEKITAHLLKIIRPGDLVIFLGAGDIVKICDELAEELKK